MTKPLLILTLLLGCIFAATAQEETETRREPVPYSPPIEKTIVEELPNPSQSIIPISTGFKVPSGSAESMALSGIQDIPVNLYTGSPMVNIPIYTLQEGRLAVPLSLSYNTASIKPQALSGWVGLGWEVSGIPTITRIVRGYPDEGFTQNGSGKKGYYTYGSSVSTSTMMDTNLDKEPDYYFVNTPSGSGKFMFNRSRVAHFFPENDIKVALETEYNPNESGSNHYARWFKSFTVTFPDGIKYTFERADNESSAEVEVKKAQNDNIYPGGGGFSQFMKDNLTIQTWYCSKMESPYGELITFTYDRIVYSYFKSAEQQGQGFCPTNIEKKINRVYVRSSQIREISSQHFKVKFNEAARTYSTDNTVSPSEEVCTMPVSFLRLDLNSYNNSAYGLNVGKKLDNIVVSDNENAPMGKMTFNFQYSYFNASDYGLPTGYAYSEIGISHQRRLKLNGFTTPDGVSYSFSYDSEAQALPSRLTYGIDHWGYANGAEYNLNSPSGFIGTEFFPPNNVVCGSNRDNSFADGKKTVLTQIKSSLGTKTSFEFEAHVRNSGSSDIGGVRIKSILYEDSLRNNSIEKRYSYTLANNESSGYSFVSPAYRVRHKDGANNIVYLCHSDLFASLLSESGRPDIAYSRVVEETFTSGSSSGTGKTVTEFDMEYEGGTIWEQPFLQCWDCDVNPVYFNLSYDFKQGQVKKQEVYNANNQLISKTENLYTPNGGIKYDSTAAVRYYNSSYTFPGYSGNFAIARGYKVYFKKYRLESATQTFYSHDGTGTPFTNTVSYTYKDEMPATYRNTYKRMHNMPVKISSSDEDGNNLESLILYTGDFSFDLDTAIFCPDYDICASDNTQECPRPGCEEWEITFHVPPYSTEARGIYDSQTKNILNSIIEQRQLVNGQTVSANYNELFSASPLNSTLTRKSYFLKNIPKTTFVTAYYNKPSLSMVKETDYELAAEAISYNSKGMLIGSRNNKNAISVNRYQDNLIPIGQTTSVGNADSLRQTAEYGKFYLGQNKLIAPNLLEVQFEKDPFTGKPTYDRDKDNRVLKRYALNTTLANISSLSWNSPQFTKTCNSPYVTYKVVVNGLLSPATAQFSTDGGASWNSANLGTNSYVFTRSSGTGTQQVLARASDNVANVINTDLDISCTTPVPFAWGTSTVSTHQAGPPKVCKYNLSVVGLSAGSYAQFSIDSGATWIDENNGSGQMQFILLAPPATQQFWARDYNNPTNVITTHLNGCP